MQTHLTKQRRNFHFIPNWSQNHQNIIPIIKKSQSSIKLAEVQTFKLIQQGYFTPNTLKIKFMCKNHANSKSTHFYETIEGQKIYYCSACSNEITKQGFSVKNLNQIKKFNSIQSKHKFEPKKFDFMKKKTVSQEEVRFEVLKTAEKGISQLERKANLQIMQIDEYGKTLLEQLNRNFNEVIRFLQNQKQNCIQLIFDKIDQLKKPLHELKNNICNQMWELENIKARFQLLNNQQKMQQMKESLASISNNEYKKIEKIVQRKEELKKILEQKVVMDKNNCFQSLGSVQEIIENVYNNFFIKSLDKNFLSDLSVNLISKDICQETVSEFPSPIRIKNPREPESNQTLKQEIKNIENTIKREETSIYHGYFALNQKAEKINQFAISIKQHTNQMIKKRPSQITTISSLTNLMS